MLGSSPQRDTARALYIASVAQARNPFFYLNAGVPDTLDGRFDLIVLHLFMLQNRLVNPGKLDVGAPFTRLLVEIFIDDMDRNLREMGVGDVGVGKRVRAMSEALYGRFAAYDDALAAKRDWSEVLTKNIYGKAVPTEMQVRVLEEYVKKLHAHLALASADALHEGTVSYEGIIKNKLF